MTDTTKTFLPIVRKIIPHVIGKKLVSVQPMSIPIGQAFSINNHLFESESERMLREDFGGVPKEVIIELLKKHYPENFI